MKKVVVGGVLYKEEIQALITNLSSNQLEVEIMKDLDAAFAIKAGKADYYVGACNTGGGGAIAMAIGILGQDKCASIATPAKIMSEEEIASEFSQGKIAFGFTGQASEKVLPKLIELIIGGEK